MHSRAEPHYTQPGTVVDCAFGTDFDLSLTSTGRCIVAVVVGVTSQTVTKIVRTVVAGKVDVVFGV